MPAGKARDPHDGRDLVDIREATRLIHDARSELLQTLHSVTQRISDLDREFADRHRELESRVRAAEGRQEYARGRSAAVAALVSIPVAIITALLLRTLAPPAPEPSPLPTPQITVTVIPQAEGPRVVERINGLRFATTFSGRIAILPAPSPDARSPSPAPSPSPSPTRPAEAILAAVCSMTGVCACTSS